MPSFSALLSRVIPFMRSAGMVNPLVSLQTDFVIQYYPETVTLLLQSISLILLLLSSGSSH